jgi:hypothetical protein
VGPPLGSSSLPHWFDANRVQGHTRLTFGRRLFDEASTGFMKLGAVVLTRHVKSRDEDPWWPTLKPLDDDGQPHSSRPRVINGETVQPGDDIAGRIIGNAHAEGLMVMAYYWDASEATLAATRPEWICRDDDRTKTFDSRGIALDLTGPYGEVVLTRLQELAARGANGLFFDHTHLPREGCWETALETAWTAATGEPAPPRPRGKELPTERYLEFLDFRAKRIEETFAHWRARVKAQHPGVVFVVSTDDFASLMNRGVTTRLARIADSAKNEYQQPLHDRVIHDVFTDNVGVLAEPPGHVRQSLSWTVLRDSADGRPPHIWHPGVPSEDQAEALAASIVTFGAIANMDVAEKTLDDGTDTAGKTPVAGLRRAFDLGKRVSPHLAGTQPVRWAALHFGERSRSRRGFQWLEMWQQVLWPFVGPYTVLTEDGLPVGVVNDDQLEHGQLAGYRLLVLPNPNELTDGQRRQAEAFARRGGVKIASDRWPWSDPSHTAAAAAAFRAALAPHRQTAPVAVTGGPPGRYAVAYRKPGRLVVAVTNKFGWVQNTIPMKPGDPVNDKPEPARGVRIVWGPAGPVTDLRALEAVTNRVLTGRLAGTRYVVELPSFQYMALLVVDTP